MKRDVALNVAEWNVCTLMDRSASQRPERQKALVAIELDRYRLDVAERSETRLPGYDSLDDVLAPKNGGRVLACSVKS